MDKLNKIVKQLQKLNFEILLINNGFEINHKNKKLTELYFEIEAEKLVFPLREGEFIKDITHLKEGEEYSLSYPGTASTKSMVIFSPDGGGIFIGGYPTFEWAKIKIKRLKNKTIKIIYNSPEHHLYFLEFNINWRLAADQYKQILGIAEYKAIKRKPKYFLQIGVKDSYGKCGIKHFTDLKVPIDYFHKHLGPGHIIHFYGTNKDGFDRMAPDYTVDPALGGVKALTELIKYCQDLGHLTSHHYNPRYADHEWINTHPEYREAIVRKKDHSYVHEHYKGKDHFYMNPNIEIWYQRSMKTVNYLHKLGLDYIQLDQFTYQRNFYNPHKPLQLGYKRMIGDFEKRGIKHWLEGVSDVHKLKEGNFYQILTRDIPQVWEDNESRRGYPYGVFYPAFFMYLYPDAEVSFQLVTEKNHFKNFERRLRIARRINAAVYDLQMTFYDDNHYMDILKKLIDKIHEHKAEKG